MQSVKSLATDLSKREIMIRLPVRKIDFLTSPKCSDRSTASFVFSGRRVSLFRGVGDSGTEMTTHSELVLRLTTCSVTPVPSPPTKREFHPADIKQQTWSLLSI
jgi:hypothetical protein